MIIHNTCNNCIFMVNWTTLCTVTLETGICIPGRLIDIGSQSEIELIERLAHEVFDKVIKSGGTITGEHGDGLARVKYIKYMYGSRIFSLFREVKKLFDPKFIMNPGKKVTQPIN